MKNLYKVISIEEIKGGGAYMKAKDSHYVEQLWNSWINEQSEQAANELLEHYMYLVHFHVERVASYIPGSFDKNDLKSLGLMGLFDALNKFDPKRNLKFDTYATIRIRGSIMDGLRKEDWLPRSLREQAKKIEQVSQQLEQKLNRTPTSADIAKELNMEKEEVESIVTDTLFANVISIDTTYTTDDMEETTDLGSTIEDEEAVNPDEHVELEELKEELIEGIKSLTKNEQIVISLFYQEELTLTEIGQVLDLTTSRISQIHKRAIFKLKDILTKMKVIN